MSVAIILATKENMKIEKHLTIPFNVFGYMVETRGSRVLEIKAQIIIFWPLNLTIINPKFFCCGAIFKKSNGQQLQKIWHPKRKRKLRLEGN